MFKSNKGYSLVEVGVGILILTMFLIVSIGLFNGAYTNYRRIKQRNIAINSAVSHLEAMLQSDANELTGFFIQELDTSKNRFVLKPCDELVSFVESHYSTSEPEEYIEDHTNKVINDYIKENIESASSEDRENGNYGFMTHTYDDEGNVISSSPSNTCVVEYNNGQINPGSTIYVTTNDQPLKIVRTVTRLSAEDGKAYGNEVLKLKVEVFYTSKFGENIPEEDIDSYTLETIKVTNTAA